MSDQVNKLALPTPSQLEWADKEIGVIIHFDLQVFQPGYEFRQSWGNSPDLSVFNPSNLDTDQWLEAAKSAGAKYAVLVAKHCSGFSLWPTKAHDYHVGNTPWKNGQGDVVGDFFKSCAKYDIKPGIYCSASCNGYLLVDNPGKVLTDDPEFLEKYNKSRDMQSGKGSVWASEEKQLHYNWVVETQLTELWSNYGKLFEIWFDGGVLPPEQGGPSVVPIMKRLQPDAVVFGGPRDWPSLVRFIGNEGADVPDPFWSTTNNLKAFDGTEKVSGLGGDPDGQTWSPGEADMPNRIAGKALQGGWFWREGDDKYLWSVDHLTECYMQSVGRNTNLLLGMVIDNRGMVPEADQQQFADFGKRIASIFSNPVNAVLQSGEDFALEIPDAQPVNMVVIQEQIEFGERIRKYVIEVKQDGEWHILSRGSCIGHKRIVRFEAIETSAIRLRILESVGEPKLRNFTAWYADQELFSVPMDPAKRTIPKISRDKNGLVNISCSNPNLTIRYSIDGQDPDKSSPVYEKPFPLPNGGTVKAYDFINDLSRSEIISATFGVDRSDWQVVRVSLDSPFENKGHAGVDFLLDDDPDYYWHTYHTDTTKSASPHEVDLDMNRTINVKSFTLMPRSLDGAPDDCEFFLSDDGEKWKLVTHAKFADIEHNHGMRTVDLETPMSGRYLRLKVNHVFDGNDFVAVAGIGVVE